MRLGVDARSLSDRYYSGIAEYTANLLPEIISQSSNDDYFSLFNNSFSKQPLHRLDWLRSDKAEVANSRIPNKIFNYPLERLLRYPKLDKLTNTEIFWLPHFNFASFSREIPFVLTIHDLSFIRYPEFFNNRKNLWHNLLPIKRLADSSAKIVAVSEHTKMDIVELLGISEEKVEVIHSGLAPRIEVSEEERIRIISDFGLNKPYILYLGTVEPRKNVAGLIEAFDLLKKNNLIPHDFRLIIAGAWGWKAKKIKEAWNKSPFKDEIKFLGYISQKEKEVLYSYASVFAYPSFYEGFGFPPLEAMLRSCPVVVSNSSSLPEICGEAALYCTAGDVNSLSLALERVINSSELRSSLISLGKEQAAKYSWQKAASAYLSLFKSL